MEKKPEILDNLERELSLKQLQIRSLEAITQAINENIPANQLFDMYKSFLSWDMGVQSMALYTNDDGKWHCVSKINDDDELEIEDMDGFLSRFDRLRPVWDSDPAEIKKFDYVIPVFHKKQPLAYAFIGGMRKDEGISDKIQFIRTITNIILVAIENKRLFKRQLEQEKLNREIKLAKEVQQMLIPEHLPVNDRYELASIYMPHLNVGGDYIDFFQFSKDKFAFCIADISGKGVAAAMLMANFQAIIQSLIYQYRDLETFIFALNETVYKRITKSDKYITFFIAEVDLKKKKLKYINAGHYPPILCTGGKVKRLDSGCTVIGAFEKMPDIQEEVIDLEGDTLILTFTDGLTELKNKKGEFLRDSQIEKFVCNHNNLPITEFNDKLLKEIDNFKASDDYLDDIAILSCKIKSF